MGAYTARCGLRSWGRTKHTLGTGSTSSEWTPTRREWVSFVCVFVGGCALCGSRSACSLHVKVQVDAGGQGPRATRKMQRHVVSSWCGRVVDSYGCVRRAMGALTARCGSSSACSLQVRYGLHVALGRTGHKGRRAGHSGQHGGWDAAGGSQNGAEVLTALTGRRAMCVGSARLFVPHPPQPPRANHPTGLCRFEGRPSPLTGAHDSRFRCVFLTFQTQHPLRVSDVSIFMRAIFSCMYVC